MLKPEEIKFTPLPHLFPMKTALQEAGEIEQMKIGVSQGHPSLKLGAIKEDTLCVVGYGPSLADTWGQVTHPCLTVSGAHDYLIARGIVPDFHVECDGRPHKARFLEKPVEGCEYLIATVCHPKFWEQLEGFKVTTWHNALGQHAANWIGANDPGTIMVSGGSVVGLSAIHVAGVMGYRKFRLFGFDNCFRFDKRHAGEHYGPEQKLLWRTVGDKTYLTTPQMTNAADEIGWLIRDNPQISVEIVGESMTKELHGAKSADA